MIMFPGGFSAGDEPDGSAKFFATAFQNAKIKEAVMKLLNERMVWLLVSAMVSRRLLSLVWFPMEKSADRRRILLL